MELLLLGTGGPRGWPEPGCRCASCATSRARGEARAATAVLVDGVLLLDGSADAVAGDVRQVRSGPQHPPADDPQGAHALRPLPHGDGWAWDVTGPDGVRLLYAPRPAALPAAGGHPPYDVVLLSATRLPESLAQLRLSGAVTASTDVLAVALDHDSPLPDEHARLLRAWGARTVPDGTTVAVEHDREPREVRGRTLVLGGARSGKSHLAEQLLAACPDVTYVATGGTRDGDPEWRARVAAHVVRRPSTWRTVETVEVAACLREADGPLLVDCLGTWLTARLDAHEVWQGAPVERVEDDVEQLVAAWRAAAFPVVAVSNEVGSGVVPATPSGRLFRDLLGRLNARVAAQSETVLLTVAGIAVPLREPR